jgi:transposase-like protein
MSDYIADMYRIKKWDRDAVAELAQMAKRNGIPKGKLATDWLGVHQTTLSYWMAQPDKGYREPPEMAKRLLSLIEPIIRRKEAERLKKEGKEVEQ